jgi:hypothetical protein
MTTTQRPAINLERARKLLVTPIETLKLLQKKEDFEIKKKNENRQKKSSTNEKAEKVGYRPFAKVEIPNDHLPFQTMLVKIAASMPGHPPKPKFHARMPEYLIKSIY